MEDFIALLVIVAIVGGAVAYIVRQKKAGAKCIGCSVGQECADRAKAAQAGEGCGCGCGSADKMVANMEKAAK